MFGTTRRRSVVMRGRLRGYFVKEKLVRNTLLRLAVLLVFWFSFLDLFWGTTRGHWIWTVGVIAAFFLAEGMARLAMRVYLNRGN